MKTLEQLRQYQYFWERMESACAVWDLLSIPKYNRRYRYCQRRAQAAYQRAKAVEREQEGEEQHVE